MKYAVIYYSETGNTKALSKYLFENIHSTNKVLINMEDVDEIPKADMYFIGFPIYNQNCRMKVIELIEQIENSKIALLVTCGLNPTEQYKDKLEDTLSVWISNSNEYLGMQLCQCKTVDSQKQKFYQMYPQHNEQLEEMFERIDNNPIENNMLCIKEFIQNVI